MKVHLKLHIWLNQTKIPLLNLNKPIYQTKPAKKISKGMKALSF